MAFYDKYWVYISHTYRSYIKLLRVRDGISQAKLTATTGMLSGQASLDEETAELRVPKDNQNQEDKPVKTSGLRAKKERKKSDIKERKKETWLNLDKIAG